MRFQKIFTLLLISLFAFTNCYANTHDKKPTLILVHGALLTSNSWIGVQSYLQNHGYNVLTVDMPGRAEDGIDPKTITLNSAVDKLCQVVNLQHGKVILGGHSQGGAVITQALAKCGDRIKGLIYIAAVAPLSGENVFAMLNDQDNNDFNQCATLNTNSGLYEINYQGPLKEMFMDDATLIQANKAINNMAPEPAAIGDGVLEYDATLFNQIPKFYIQTTKDRIISLDTQKKIQAKIKLNKVYTMDTGHSPFVSQPQILGKNLADAIDSIAKS